MELFHSWLVASIPALLGLAGLVPTRWSNRHAGTMRQMVMSFSALAFAMSLTATGLLMVRGPLDASLRLSNTSSIGVGIYFDSLTAVMLTLVSFLGLVVTRYSIRYLDGDPTQGRFMRWISLTLGSTFLLVIANNLVVFTAAWLLTSWGLHQLLTHYKDRSGAIMAARTKFLISRLGDTFLVAALVLTYYLFGSVEYGPIFAAAQRMREEGGEYPWLVSAIGTLYVCGAMTKSAQFPFHSWLPDTMETPTPVSALMHAGLVNAGGFLVLRLSPLISLAHVPLDLLAIVGAITAIFGAVVMLTQTSIKRYLAYSTIAQMGFMMLQCGLGAFSAALLHIVAHSLYKAHAFLRSGSVLEESAGMRLGTWLNDSSSGLSPRRASPHSISLILGATLAGFVICTAIAWGFGLLTYHKPGGILLTLILAIAITHLLAKFLAVPNLVLNMIGLLTAIGVTLSYYVAYVAIDHMLAASVSHFVVPPSTVDAAIMLIVAVAFTGLFLLQIALTTWDRPSWLNAFYVHAANGFYLDVISQQLTAKVWKRQTRPGRIQPVGP